MIHTVLPHLWIIISRQGITTLSALVALCEGNPPISGGFPSQRASGAKSVCSCHNVIIYGLWIMKTAALKLELAVRTRIRTGLFNENTILFLHSNHQCHYDDVIMTTMAAQITSLTVVYSTVYSDANQRKHQSSASLAFVWGIHRDRWIPCTKGQLRGKCFHLMTSSCSNCLHSIECAMWAFSFFLTKAQWRSR